jgi:hypothetical protein
LVAKDRCGFGGGTYRSCQVYCELTSGDDARAEHQKVEKKRAALSVGRPTWPAEIGCCPGRWIAIYRPKIAAANVFAFCPWFLENQPTVLSLSVETEHVFPFAPKLSDIYNKTRCLV